VALRFAIQADIHSFKRVPRRYLEGVLDDAKRIGCAFVAWLGDVIDGDQAPLELLQQSPIPIVYQHGDHELMSEWGRTGFRCYGCTERGSDPLAFFRGAAPRYEALTGLPTAWSFDLMGVHFVVCFNGKDTVWYPWFLRWLEGDLGRAGSATTVLLSHRPLDDRGETAEALRSIVGRYPCVRLYCYGHVHEGRELYRVGRVLTVNAEACARAAGASYEAGWYVVVEIGGDSVRVLRRRLGGEGFELLAEDAGGTTLNPLERGGRFHLAYLLCDGAERVIPLDLERAAATVYGVSVRQLATPEGGAPPDGVRAEPTPASAAWRGFGIERVLRLRRRGAREPAELARWEVPVRFEADAGRVGEAGTLGEGTSYMVLALVRGPPGARVELRLECRRGDSSLESEHWVRGSLGEGVCALWALIGHIKFNPPNPYWRWMGVGGCPEVDRVPGPRSAARLDIALLSDAGELEAVAFVYPHEAFFTPVPRGEWSSEDVRVEVAGKVLEVGSPGEAGRRFELGSVKGGSRLSIRCGGSRLALVAVEGVVGDALLALERLVRGAARAC